MTAERDLSRIRAMADIIMDARSASLSKSTEQRAAVLSQIAALSISHGDAQNDLAAAKTALSFEVWASHRRSELNLRLAEVQARWLADMEEARRAFARVQLLRRLDEDRRSDTLLRSSRQSWT